MSDPLTFAATSHRFGLPLLHAAQAQKEFFVNEAMALTDALLHCAIEGTANSPPAAPTDGEIWLISTAPIGDWSGQAGKIAVRQFGNWLFVAPRDGMRILDRSTGQEKRYWGSWRFAATPAAVSGGTTIDAEARAALTALTNALKAAGVLAAS